MVLVQSSEIGCGTGSSTVAMVEQGAHVTGVEMAPAALVVARRQCELYDCTDVAFVEANATDAVELVDVGSYDVVLFFAVLEHMTSRELLTALPAYWERMRPGAILGVIEAPNRLWLWDQHTAELPFFHWLPRRSRCTIHASARVR